LTQGKSHTDFPLVPKLMTLNGVMTVILRYFIEVWTWGQSPYSG